MSPLTQGLRYCAACDEKRINTKIIFIRNLLVNLILPCHSGHTDWLQTALIIDETKQFTHRAMPLV